MRGFLCRNFVCQFVLHITENYRLIILNDLYMMCLSTGNVEKEKVKVDDEKLKEICLTFDDHNLLK